MERRTSGPVRDVPAGPIAALNRPDPVLDLLAGLEHFPIAGLVGAIPAHSQDIGVLADHLDRGRPLVGVHPDDHAH